MDATPLKPTLAAVLRAFTRPRPPRSSAAAARMLGLDRSTVARARGVLVMLGRIEKNSRELAASRIPATSPRRRA
jgi:DNA-binding IclR family transcriptional regulator